MSGGTRPATGPSDGTARTAVAADERAARLTVRLAGYCVVCDRIVERDAEGACPAGHPPQAITGKLVLGPDEPVPRLPRFNLAAFLLPPIWGPAHGQWAGAIFLPLWLFADSVVRTAAHGLVTAIAAVVVVGLTLAGMAWFGKRANGLAWRRVWDRVSVDEFIRRQHIWALACAPVSAALLALALYFDLVVLPARGL